MIKIDDKTFELFLSTEEIQTKVKDLASRIQADFGDELIDFVVILNGSFIFASDLIKEITGECRVHFLKLSSYLGTQSTGLVKEHIGLNSDLLNKNIVVLEDIIDTGLTLQKINSILQAQNPACLKVCTLLFKPEVYKGNTDPDYIGFSIPNKFVVGYGLDYNEKGRNYKDIYQLHIKTNI